MRYKKILIFDEHGFGRVCSALLQNDGYEAKVVTSVDGLPSGAEFHRFGLIITSYPYGALLVGVQKRRGVSTIVLCNGFDENFLEMLKDFNDTYCMMKPLDYDKFRSVVRQVMNGESDSAGGYHFFV